ncbi:hypothetical protein PENTCL1PPCAC_12792 [Pristionchus entomophagus]|uniref:G protein-coupled receptor n=1 Tax=Pristionchus entomophagus TaxID=358040 RepID=A0AAV5T897_9BILA|nr:hypothetical protein PENTCL1PPCAC_12792 [Pristionchus entomophagus]
MYFVNYLNRNRTGPFFPMFEIIYGVEISLIISAFVAGIIVICMTLKTRKLHLLIRLRIISGIINDLVYITSRLLVMHHEYFGLTEYVETLPLIFGTMMKQIFLGYMTLLYESSANSTLLFFLLQEAILFSLAIF